MAPKQNPPGMRHKPLDGPPANRYEILDCDQVVGETVRINLSRYPGTGWRSPLEDIRCGSFRSGGTTMAECCTCVT